MKQAMLAQSNYNKTNNVFAISKEILNIFENYKNKRDSSRTKEIKQTRWAIANRIH